MQKTNWWLTEGMVMGGGGGEKKLSEEDEDIQTSSWKVNESHI